MSHMINAHVLIESNKIKPTQQNITLTIPVPEGTYIYKEYLDISVDNPEITLSPWQANLESVQQYDPVFKETKKVFNKNITIHLQATAAEPSVGNAHIHVVYYLNTNKKICEEVFPLHFSTPKEIGTAMALAIDAQEISVTTQAEQKIVPPTAEIKPATSSSSWSSYISALVQKADSLAVQLLLVLLLGILLSLTPCIYPMIPITVGILQSQGNKSLGHNFLVSLCYTTGIAITFALLGLMAAFTGQVFGSIMNNPLVILAIICMLVYLALSMFGLYEMYIPKSFQGGNQGIKKGNSFLSAFIFGIASGSVASPCLSPGLVLLLSIVSTLGSTFLGFLMLFVFGIGLGLPLLIVGTFSSSLNMLPRAGIWMIEIKTLFGFMMLGMCFYFLNFLLPWHILSWMIALFVACMGIFYIYSALHTESKPIKLAKNIFGILSIAASVVLASKAYISSYKVENDAPAIWISLPYKEVHAKAKEENKKIFLAFGAPSCSLCKAINKTTFQKEQVICTLKNCYCIKLEDTGSTSADEAYNMLQKEYKILGFPTYLLIDPQTCAELQRWGGELYDIPDSEFIDDLNKFIKPLNKP